MKDYKFKTPHLKDCDVEHYPDCFSYESCKCWCHKYSDNNGIPNYDYKKLYQKYDWYWIYYDSIKCNKCIYSIPDYYDEISDCFYTNDITKQILCKECFYIENILN